MNNPIAPKAGFDWNRVCWSRPDSLPPRLCSYCSAGIPETTVPLILTSEQGFTARFCDDCMEKWWGMSTYPDPPEFGDF